MMLTRTEVISSGKGRRQEMLPGRCSQEQATNQGRSLLPAPALRSPSSAWSWQFAREQLAEQNAGLQVPGSAS